MHNPFLEITVEAEAEVVVEVSHRSIMLRQAGRHEKRQGKQEDERRLRVGNYPFLPYLILNKHLTSRCLMSSEADPKVIIDYESLNHMMVMIGNHSYLPPQILFFYLTLLNTFNLLPVIHLFIFFDFFGGGPANVTGGGPATLRVVGRGLSTISASFPRLGLVSFFTTWTDGMAWM